MAGICFNRYTAHRQRNVLTVHLFQRLRSKTEQNVAKFLGIQWTCFVLDL